MPYSVGLGVPGVWALWVLAVLIWGFSGFVAINSLRRRRTDYAGVFEGRWFYAIPQAIFFVAFILFIVWLPWAQTFIPWIAETLVALPFVLAQQMAYLLRVVFPTSKRLEKRLDAECALLREDDEDAEAAKARRGTGDDFFDPDNPDA
jgi:hypothetical protein